MLFDHRDEDLGHYMLWLSAEAVADLAANISGMLDNPETFRAKWEQENRDKKMTETPEPVRIPPTPRRPNSRCPTTPTPSLVTTWRSYAKSPPATAPSGTS